MAYNFSRLSVLVVEDSVFLRQLLRSVLVGLGVREIKEAIDGSDALEVMSTWTPDIAFVDWDMEPMNGLEFTREVRHHETELLRFLPIIMVSSYTTLKAITDARDAGISEFLAKPISPAAVYARIALTIEQPRDFVRVGDYFGPDRRRKVEDMADDERRRTEASYIPISKDLLTSDAVKKHRRSLAVSRGADEDDAKDSKPNGVEKPS